jgi:hypothetical protein
MSPALLFEHLGQACGKKTCNVPHVRISESANKTGFYYDSVSYSLAGHPLIADARKVLLECFPFVRFKNEGERFESKELLKTLSIHDADYAEFLFTLLRETGLIKKQLSIKSILYEPVPDFEDFFKKLPEEILKIFTDATIRNLVTHLHMFLPVNSELESEIYDTLLRRNEFERLFMDFYELVGIEENDLFALDFDKINHINENEEDLNSLQMLFTGTFYVGATLEKYFTAPFAHYFQFLRPSYAALPDMMEEIIRINAQFEVEESEMVIAIPCSSFVRTKLGEDFLRKSYPSEESIEESNAPEKTDASNVFKAIDITLRVLAGENVPLKKQGLEQYGDAFAPEKEIPLYRMQIFVESNEKFWQTIEITNDISIEGIHRIICHIFGIDDICEYNFYPSAKETPFNEYGAAVNQNPVDNVKKRRDNIRKTRTFGMNRFVERAGQVFIYIARNTMLPCLREKEISDIKFIIVVTDIETTTKPAEFPKRIKASKAFSQWENDRDF